jgi:guanylate kinase
VDYEDIVVIIGPAGSGKNTLINLILANLPEYRLARSATTRGFRPSDDRGGTGFNSKYVYVDDERFQDLIARDVFMEFNDDYVGSSYGTLEPDPRYRPLLEIEIVGAAKVKERYPQARIVFITVPGKTTADCLVELERRMRGRALATGDIIDEENLAKRLVRARREYSEGVIMADTVITNDDAKEAAARLLKFIGSR